MIAVCPKCSARYRVEPTRVGPEGAKLRCSKCSALFLVRVPPSGSPTPEPARADRPLVLVADADANRAKASAEAVTRQGFAARLVHDGVEAMLAIQRMLPRIVVLDASLPRMNGLEICEIVKRNESLRGTRVVLVGGGRAPDRDPASERYGPDDHLESPDLPDALAELLAGPGHAPPPASTRVASPMPAAPTPSSSSPASAPVPAATATAGPARVAAARGADAAREEERERARRLARIAVSEMLLYQPDKFAQACRDGTLERALEVEIQEARALIRQRIGPEVRAETDFVLDELHRVARERGART